MHQSRSPISEDVDQLLLNARLRDELEPFFDESMHLLNARRLPTQTENEFLASMLAWERAPVLPIREWFEPELEMPHPDTQGDEQLSQELWRVIHKLYEKRIVLEFTDHLANRQLYCLIYRDILPSPEKKIDMPRNYFHWHCLDHSEEPETWLMYYATEQERDTWAEETGITPPAAVKPPFPRRMPSRTQ